ncbi:MAG: undecaprenyl-diphosphate phosphatase [Thermodesulfovibrionia bacterium]|nr:undecaprenyl-diphosphate phosphatase [Thermodesulfovibrionia bacterium]
MLEAVILGIVQGLTEFIPVSSSGHLIIFRQFSASFLNWHGIINTLSFDVALHFGTLLALLFYFRKDWIEIIKTLPQRESLAWKLFIGSIPAVCAGLLLHNWIEQHRSLALVAFTLSFVSIFMIVSERNYEGSERFGLDKLDFRSALIIGIAQAFALVPGVSRSGLTIVAGLMRKMRRDEAARFSFLLGTPAVAGASIFEAQNFMGSEHIVFNIFIVGIIVSAVTGYLVIKYLLLFLQKHSLRPFAYYRFLLAFVIILFIKG